MLEKSSSFIGCFEVRRSLNYSDNLGIKFAENEIKGSINKWQNMF